MNLFVQDAVATGLALGALALIVRRVVGVFTPPRGSSPPACASCSSCSTPSGESARPAVSETHPVAFVRASGKAN